MNSLASYAQDMLREFCRRENEYFVSVCVLLVCISVPMTHSLLKRKGHRCM